MFIASYNTYLNTDSINKTIKERESYSSKSSKLFENSLAKHEISTPTSLNNGAINYISLNKILSTKERINEQLKHGSYETDLQKISTITSKMQAPAAYVANTKMFSLMIKHPNPSKHVDSNPLKDVEEPYIRSKMVNTYMENDKYYRITA